MWWDNSVSRFILSCGDKRNSKFKTCITWVVHTVVYSKIAGIQLSSPSYKCLVPKAKKVSLLLITTPIPISAPYTENMYQFLFQ